MAKCILLLNNITPTENSVSKIAIKVLIVDDEPFIRDLLVRFLKTLNVTAIETASDGQAAFAVLSSFEPDLIILDVNMRPMNGIEFLKVLRSGERQTRRDYPVIVLTSIDEDFVFGAALALDCNAFINKSEDIRVVGKKIYDVYGRSFAIKPPAAYQVIQMPRLSDQQARRYYFPRKKAFSSTEKKRGVRRRIQDLKVGDVLANNLESGSGKLLLTAGTAITENVLRSIQDLEKIMGSLEAQIEK